MTITNLTPIYFSYVSGVINAFHPTMEEAQNKASEEGNGVQFNGSWLQATTGEYEPGSLELQGNIAVANCQGRQESVAHISQIPWVQWG